MKTLKALVVACALAVGMAVATPQPVLAHGGTPMEQVCEAAWYAYYGNGVESSIAHITDPDLHFWAMYEFVRLQLEYPELPFWEQERIYVWYLTGWCIYLGGSPP